MTDHDLALLELLRREPTSHVVDADAPAALAEALLGSGGRALAPGDVAGWVAEAQLLRARAEAVLAAEHVVARAVASEQARRSALLIADHEREAVPEVPEDGAEDDDEDGPDADRGAVRFALVVLAVAQVGGIAVHVADDMLLAAALPAVSILAVLAVVLAHRRPVRRPVGEPEVAAAAADVGDVRPGPAPSDHATAPVDAVPASPVVRAAEAHLRRQLAAWKLAWWERELPPADVGTWLGGPGAGPPATLVVVDADRQVDHDLYAAMTAALPAAVRVVLVRPRAA